MHQHRRFEIGLLWGLAAVIALSACSSQPTRKDSRMAEATREIGEAYMRQGDYTAALRELMNAQTLNPDDPIVYHNLGICYMVKNRYPDAIANFKQAIALKPSYAPARNNLGTAYLRVKEWDAAIEVFEEITKDALYATPHFPLSNLGLAYYHKGEYAKSLDYYKQALRIQENFVNALRGAGRTYLAMNDGRMALRYLTRASQAGTQSGRYPLRPGGRQPAGGKHRPGHCLLRNSPGTGAPGERGGHQGQAAAPVLDAVIERIAGGVVARSARAHQHLFNSPCGNLWFHWDRPAVLSSDTGQNSSGNFLVKTAFMV
jgi:type IV pilus assembly protein PilF